VVAACSVPTGAAGPSGSGPGGKADDGQQAVVFPQEHWTRVAPGEVGLEHAPLQRASRYAQAMGSRCLLVVKDGKLVHEWYGPDHDADSLVKTWSVGKSVGAILVGLALKQGHIDGLDERVLPYLRRLEEQYGDELKTWEDSPKQEVTIRHVLNMTSELGSDGILGFQINDVFWVRYRQDKSRSALESSIAGLPGSKWRYNNRGAQVLEPLLRAATGMEVQEFARRELWEPLGMDERTHWQVDDEGHPEMYASMPATCPDLARIGYLMLHGGQWEDEQLVPREYVRQASSPSQRLNPGYGLMWWLNGEKPIINSNNEGPHDRWHHEFAPEDMFFAEGAGNNFIDVIPSRDLVLVHSRPAPHEGLTDWDILWSAGEVVGELRNQGEATHHTQILCRLLDEPCPEPEQAAVP
jgi:CubicO group peptidase (beta-lactamase class C family)